MGSPVDAVQCIGERFARLYYGLLAVHPSALRQFYLEDSQMSRTWCRGGSAGLSFGEMPQSSPIHRGVAEIMEAIMLSVGGQDPEHSNAPVVVTKVERVQSLALPDQSGIMSHITGIITFLQEGKMQRFSQALLLEPSPEGSNLLYVRNDVVHYHDSLAPSLGQPPRHLAAPPAAAPAAAPAAPAVQPAAAQPSSPTQPASPAPAEAPAAASGPRPSNPPSAAPAAAAPVAAAAAAPAAPPAVAAPSTSAAPSTGPRWRPVTAQRATEEEAAKPSEEAATATTAASQPAAAASATAAGQAPLTPKGQNGAVPQSPSANVSWAERAAAAAKTVAARGAANGGASARKPAAKGLQALLLAATPPAAQAPTPATLSPSPTTATRTPASLHQGEATPSTSSPEASAACGSQAPAAAQAAPAQAAQASTATPSSSPSPSQPSGGTGASTAATAGAAASASEKAAVKLWVSQIPTEETRGKECRVNPVRGPEVRDVLNQCLRDHAPHVAGEVIEVDRKDERKPFAFAQLSDERTAKELVMLSKQKKVQLRGERLILDLSNYNTAPVETLYTGSAPTVRPQWHDDRGDRGVGRGGRGGKGFKGDAKGR